MDKRKSYIAPETHVLLSPECDFMEGEGITNEELRNLLQSEAMREERVQYRIKDGYCVRDFCDENLVVPVTKDTIKENQVAILNPVGRFLWDRLQTGQTFGDLLAATLGTYDVAIAEAAADIRAFLSELEAHQYLVKEKENVK